MIQHTRLNLTNYECPGTQVPGNLFFLPFVSNAPVSPSDICEFGQPDTCVVVPGNIRVSLDTRLDTQVWKRAVYADSTTPNDDELPIIDINAFHFGVV